MSSRLLLALLLAAIGLILANLGNQLLQHGDGSPLRLSATLDRIEIAAGGPGPGLSDAVSELFVSRQREAESPTSSLPLY